MSPPKDGERGAGTPRNGRGSTGNDDPGILSQLPRTRPQRSSRHRAAARDGGPAASPGAAIASAANGHAPAAPKPSRRAPTNAAPAGRSKAASASRSKADRKRAKASAGAASAMPTAPRQGFESEGERASATVHPPGGAELVASAAEIVGELAKAGLSTGDRLLKDVFSHLPF
jgi:hypothetical protein